MPLQPQDTTIPFSRGVDTKTSPLQVQAPFLLDLQNGVLDAGGAITKRHGTSVLPTTIFGSTSAITAGAYIATLRDQLVMFDQSQCYSYMQQANAWIARGRCVRTQASNRTIFTTSASQTNIASAYANNVGVFAWQDSRGGIRASIIDYATGTPYLADYQLSSTGSRPRVVATPSTLLIVYTNGANKICTRYVPTSAPLAFSAEVQLYTSAASPTAVVFDAVSFNGHVVVAYQQGTSSIIVAYLTDEGTDGSASGLVPAITFTPDQGIGGIQLTSTTTPGPYLILQNFGVASTVEMHAFNAALQQQSPTAVNVGALAYNTGLNIYASSSMLSGYAVDVIYETRATVPTVRRITIDLNELLNLTAAARSSMVVVAYNCSMALAPFMLQGIPAVPVIYSSTVQPTYFLLDNVGAIISRHLPSLAGAIPSTLGVLGKPNTPSGSVVALGVQQSGVLSSDNGTFTTTTNVAELLIDTTGTSPFNTATQGNNLYVAGAQLLLYDGTSLVEDGFHIFPEGLTVSAGGTGVIPSGSYSYIAVFGWIDARGQIHRSSPSLPFRAAVGFTQALSVSLPTLALTLKKGVFIELYRTTNAGSVYYKLTSSTAPIANDPSVPSIIYIDNALDTAITSNEILYTNGGVLPHDAAPALHQVVAVQNRLMGLSTEGDNVLYYSQEYVPGQGIAWSLALTKNVPAFGGLAQTVGAMDDKYIIFKPNLCYYFYGAGPTPTGQNDQFSAITLLSADVGCSIQNSIVLTADGLMFQSNKGIRLLDRQLQLTYPGAPVAAYDGNACTSAVMVQDQNQVRFTSASGRALVYDYYWRAPSPSGQDTIGQWSTWTNHAAVAAVLWKGIYCHLSADGVVHTETAASYTDNGAFVSMVVQTAWLPLAGPQCWFRLMHAALLGTYYSPHLLQITLAYDYGSDELPTYWDPTVAVLGPTFGSDITFGASDKFGGGAGGDGVYQVRINPSRQRCESVRFTFTDIAHPTGSAGQSCGINNLALEIGVIGGLKRLSQQKTAT